MKFILAIVIVSGALIFSIIVAVLIATLLYAVAVVCGLIAHLFNQFNKGINTTNNGTQNGWYREYIKYSIRNYLRLFFRDNRIAKAILNYLSAYANSNRHNESNQNVINFTKIPFSNKGLNGTTHSKDSNTGAEPCQPKENLTEKRRSL